MRHKIALVDDEVMIIKILRLRLEHMGFEVYTATDGAAALELIRARQPDIVLLDVRLPVLDGTEVCRRIKNDRDLRHIPIIFFSAADEEQTRRFAQEYGADDILCKPFETEELLAKINTYLSSGAAGL